MKRVEPKGEAEDGSSTKNERETKDEWTDEGGTLECEGEGDNEASKKNVREVHE